LIDALRNESPLNLLLVCVPAAFVLHAMEAGQTWVFAVSCAAIIPLAGLMGKSTEAIAHRLGPGVGGLLNASFGNAAELIIAIVALQNGLVDVVKASITGSIMGNVLLVLGASFFAGGLRYEKQKFNATAAGMSATLLALAAIGLLVPAMFHAHLLLDRHLGGRNVVAIVEKDLSLEIAIVLFAVYGLMLLFSLKTHKHLYNAGEAAGASVRDDPEVALPARQIAARSADGRDGWPQWLALSVLIASTVLVALMSELLVGAIEETSRHLGWTQLFVGVVVVAIVGNAAEHSTAVLAALRNDMELGFQIAIGSGLQVALFVAPALVFISYLPGFPATLDLVFTMLEVVAVGVSVMVVGLVAYDGRSNWMEGLLLLAVYVILGIAFYHLPGSTGGH
jgi:Ca2+:H+ antiporter